jgi:hypothetical protein
MSTPGKTHPSVIPPPPIKKIINNKRTLYIPALQAPRQLFNEVEGGRDSNHGLCLYTHTQARFGCGDIYTVSHPVFPPAGASINLIQSFLYLSGPSYWKNSTGGRWRSTHLYTCIYTYQLLAVVCIYPIHPSSFHIVYWTTALKSNETKEAKVIYYYTIYHLESSFWRNLIFDGRQCIK